MFEISHEMTNGEIRLEFLSEKHAKDLAEIVLADNIWEYCVFRISTPAELDNYIQEALIDHSKNKRITYAIVTKNGKAIGSTALGNYSPVDSRVEVGWSWLGSQYHGTGINKQAKYILLTYCFDYLALHRVEFKTDIRNQKAKGGLKSIGATEEGMLRSHTLMHTGHRRDTVYYSILTTEWPTIQKTIFKHQAQAKVSMLATRNQKALS